MIIFIRLCIEKALYRSIMNKICFITLKTNKNCELANLKHANESNERLSKSKKSEFEWRKMKVVQK